jgi:hypothetical protein
MGRLQEQEIYGAWLATVPFTKSVQAGVHKAFKNRSLVNTFCQFFGEILRFRNYKNPIK